MPVVDVTVILWGVVGVRVRAPVCAAVVKVIVAAVRRALMHPGQPLLLQGVVDGCLCKSAGPVLGEALMMDVLSVYTLPSWSSIAPMVLVVPCPL